MINGFFIACMDKVEERKCSAEQESILVPNMGLLMGGRWNDRSWARTIPRECNDGFVLEGREQKFR